MRAAALATAIGTAAAMRATPQGIPIDEFIGLQHFQPCYYINASVGCFIDGALQAARVGTRTFKFDLSWNTPSMYPFNNGGAPWPAAASSLAELVNATQFRDLLSNKYGTNFLHYVIWAYRIGPSDSYWCDEMTPADEAAETAEFQALTETLMSQYAGTGLTFTLE